MPPNCLTINNDQKILLIRLFRLLFLPFCLKLYRFDDLVQRFVVNSSPVPTITNYLLKVRKRDILRFYKIGWQWRH